MAETAQATGNLRRSAVLGGCCCAAARLDPVQMESSLLLQDGLLTSTADFSPFLGFVWGTWLLQIR